MRTIAIAAALAWPLVLAPSGGARADASPSDASAIRSVITAQIEAFRRDDGAAAFALAAPGIRQRFGDGDTFLGAVRTAYRAVYRPRSFTFGALSAQADGDESQIVDLIGPDGGLAVAHYTMEPEPDGTWRIAGCELETPAQTSV